MVGGNYMQVKTEVPLRRTVIFYCHQGPRMSKLSPPGFSLERHDTFKHAVYGQIKISTTRLRYKGYLGYVGNRCIIITVWHAL